MNLGINNELYKYIKNKNPLKLRSNNKQIVEMEIFEDILKNTNDTYSDKARIYLYIMGLYDIKCHASDCTNVIKFDNDKNSFRMFCSVKCRNKDITLRQSASEKWDAAKIAAKNKKTVLTCNSKYGVDNPMQSKKFQDKSKETCMKRYGVEYVTQSEKMLKKTKETCLEKYGVEYVWQSKTVRDKATTTTRLRTGVDNINQKNIKNFKNWNNKEFIETNFLSNGKILLTKMSDYFNCHEGTCRKKFNNLNIVYNTNKGSIGEQEVSDYINSLNINFKENDRSVISPLELDILCPDHNIAFEFNGLYWHSYGANNVNNKQQDLKFVKNRHKIKTFNSKDKGIQLFHIFENEWNDPNLKIIWKSQISNALKCNTIKIGARKCEIIEVTSKVCNKFLDENHLQGKCSASVNIALVYKGEIVSIMTFGKSRYDKNIDFELIRFCSKLFTQIPGAASRLLKYFERTYSPHGLVSYANARWSNGHLYKTIGFTDAGYSNPNYFYYHESNPKQLFSRVKFQKHKLPSLLKTFDKDKTEMQNMVNNGYRAIYDSGNYKFTKTY